MVGVLEAGPQCCQLCTFVQCKIIFLQRLYYFRIFQSFQKLDSKLILRNMSPRKNIHISITGITKQKLQELLLSGGTI